MPDLLTTFSDIELTAANPWRPVDWRWQRALNLYNGEFQTNRRFDDRYILEAVAFRTRLEASDTAVEKFALAARFPELFWAWKLYTGASHEWRMEAEARVLAGVSSEELCARIGMETRAFKVYEKLFYDVRVRLSHPAYILHIVIGQSLHRGLRESDWALLWKFYGYTYGPFMLDSVISQTIDPVKPMSPGEVMGVYNGDSKGSRTRKNALAARTIPVNSFTQMDIMNVHAKYVELDRAYGGGESSEGSGLMDNVNKFFSVLRMVVGEPAEDSSVDSGYVSNYDKTATELPMQQLIMAANGEDPAQFVGDGDLNYPEPINHARAQAAGS